MRLRAGERAREGEGVRRLDSTRLDGHPIISFSLIASGSPAADLDHTHELTGSLLPSHMLSDRE